MSAFSRGCVLRQQGFLQPSRTLHLLPKSYQTIRFLSTTSLLQAIKKTRSQMPFKRFAQPLKPSLTPTKGAPAHRPSTYGNYAAILAQKSHPTLLYQAPSHTMFMISSYSASIFCFTYATLSFWSQYVLAPPDLASWVPIAYGGISVFMSAMGCWLFLAPSRLIRSITAVPKHLATYGKWTPIAAKSASPELLVEVELRKMLPIPFFPARKLSAKPEDIIMPSTISSLVDPKLTPDELRVRRIEEDRLKKEAWEYEKSHIMTAPFRHASQAFYQLFKNLGRTWTREGFYKLQIKKQKGYKLDVNGGWALDSGRALDRLVAIKPRL